MALLQQIRSLLAVLARRCCVDVQKGLRCVQSSGWCSGSTKQKVPPSSGKQMEREIGDVSYCTTCLVYLPNSIIEITIHNLEVENNFLLG